MGKGGSSGSTVVGHAYSMGVAYGLCEKVDRLLGFKFENDLVAKPNLSSSGSFTPRLMEVAIKLLLSNFMTAHKAKPMSI